MYSEKYSDIRDGRSWEAKNNQTIEVNPHTILERGDNSHFLPSPVVSMRESEGAECVCGGQLVNLPKQDF